MRYSIFLPFFLLLSASGFLYADTIFLKDGQELKGIVVEDYHDRIVLSTEKGEATHLKNDIEKIRQELTTKNLRNISSIMDIQGQYLFTVGPK